jgi:hypothetical protein
VNGFVVEKAGGGRIDRAVDERGAEQQQQQQWMDGQSSLCILQFDFGTVCKIKTYFCRWLNGLLRSCTQYNAIDYGIHVLVLHLLSISVPVIIYG